MRYFTVLLAVLLLWSCSNDNDIRVKDSAYFLNDDIQEITLQMMGNDDYVYDLLINEGGYYQKEFKGSLFVDYDYLMRFNALNGTEYEMLSDNYFSYDEEFSISSDTSSVSVPLTVFTNQIFEDLGKGTYYLPFGLQSKTYEGQITEEKSNFILALTLEKPKLKLLEKGTFDIDNSTQSEYSRDISAQLNVNTTTDVVVRYEIDSDYSDGERNILDAEYYSFEKEAVMPKGKHTAENNIKVDVENAPGGLWIVPVKMFTDDDKIEVEEDSYVYILLNKGTLENLEWSEKHLLSDGENETLVFGPDGNTDIEAAGFEDDGTPLDVSVSESWVQAEISQGKIKLNIDDFQASNGDTRTAELSVFYPEGEFSKDITITQLGSGDIVGKEDWSIEAGNEFTTATGGEPFSNIIDGDINTHWQWDWPNGDDSDFPNTPYELIIDLKESQIFNAIKLWQSQSATNGYVKDVQFEVSDDNFTWEDLGTYRMSDSTDDAIEKGADPYTYQLPGVYKARYVKLIILSNVADDGVNNAKNAYMGEMDISFE